MLGERQREQIETLSSSKALEKREPREFGGSSSEGRTTGRYVNVATHNGTKGDLCLETKKKPRKEQKHVEKELPREGRSQKQTNTTKSGKPEGRNPFDAPFQRPWFGGEKTTDERANRLHVRHVEPAS